MLADMTPAEARTAIEGFASEYKEDWQSWVSTVSWGTDVARASGGRRWQVR